MNFEGWVDEKVSSLTEPEGWTPSSTNAYSRLRARDAVQARKRFFWTSVAAAASVLAVSGAITLSRRESEPASRKVAAVSTEAQEIPKIAKSEPPAVEQTKPLSNARIREEPAIRRKADSPHAQLTCELYSDFECPACASLYLQTLPRFVTEYVDSGKVKLIVRDFPLPMHPHARVAARLAKAAREFGYYDAAATQIFRTQAIWAATGDVDEQLSKALPPQVMTKIRNFVQEDSEPGRATLDRQIDEDIAAARREQVNQTPSLVVISETGGPAEKRMPVPGFVPFEILKSYIDQLLPH